MNAKENYSGFKDILKTISTILSWTILVILVLLALFLAYYTIGNKLAEKNNGKFEPFVSLYSIISPSMTPNINIGDVVVAKKVKKPEDIKVGDVITFISTSSISRGMTITHRVIEVGEDESDVTYKTKGDNNLSPDPSPAEFENVIGKVILRIPKLGRVQNLLANRGGWLIIIIIPALLIIITDILKIFKLVGVKNKIEKIDQTEQELKNDQINREEMRKKQLKKKLNIDKENESYNNNNSVLKNTNEIKDSKSEINEFIEKDYDLESSKKDLNEFIKNKKR